MIVLYFKQLFYCIILTFFKSLTANFIPAFLVDRIGRKYTVILACLPKLVICLLFLFAKEVWMILLGRGIGGVTDAMLFTVVPMYASEIASVSFYADIQHNNIKYLTGLQECIDSSIHESLWPWFAGYWTSQ